MNKVLYLFSHYPRWSETFLRQDLALLLKNSKDFFPVSLYPGDCLQQPEWPKVHLLSPKTTPSLNPSKNTHSFHLPKKIRQMISLYKHRRVLKALIQFIRDNHITAIHAEFADLAALLAVKAAQKTNIKYSLSIHAYDVHACKYPLDTIFRPANKVLVCNKAAAMAIKKKCPWIAPKLQLIYHGLILKNWSFSPHSISQSEPLKILFVGRFVPKKGLDLLLSGLALAAKRGFSFTLTLIGDGECAKSLQQQALADNLDSKIKWTGRLERSLIAHYMQKSDLFFMPSVITTDGNQDGIPNVVVEAMACGLPVMGSQAGSLPEILTDKTGWPIAELTPDLIVEKLFEFTKNTEQILPRCKEARSHVEQHFDAEKLALIRAKALI